MRMRNSTLDVPSDLGRAHPKAECNLLTRGVGAFGLELSLRSDIDDIEEVSVRGQCQMMPKESVDDC